RCACLRKSAAIHDARSGGCGCAEANGGGARGGVMLPDQQAQMAGRCIRAMIRASETASPSGLLSCNSAGRRVVLHSADPKSSPLCTSGLALVALNPDLLVMVDY